jgi:hypothetical protein
MSRAPGWLEALVEVVIEAMGESAPGQMGIRYREVDGAWDALVYPTPVELVGGAHDGDVVAPAFHLDLERLRAAFTRVDALAWQAHPFDEEEMAPCVVIEGEHAGRQLVLRVLAFAPKDEGPGTKLDVNRG